MNKQYLDTHDYNFKLNFHKCFTKEESKPYIFLGSLIVKDVARP